MHVDPQINGLYTLVVPQVTGLTAHVVPQVTGLVAHVVPQVTGLVAHVVPHNITAVITSVAITLLTFKSPYIVVLSNFAIFFNILIINTDE